MIKYQLEATHFYVALAIKHSTHNEASIKDYYLFSQLLSVAVHTTNRQNANPEPSKPNPGMSRKASKADAQRREKSHKNCLCVF